MVKFTDQQIDDILSGSLTVPKSTVDRATMEAIERFHELRADLAIAQARIAELESEFYTDSAGKVWTWQAWAEHVEAALSDLVAAFVRHRTATHVTKPNYCETCEESSMAIERARAALGEAER